MTKVAVSKERVEKVENDKKVDQITLYVQEINLIHLRDTFVIRSTSELYLTIFWLNCRLYFPLTL